MTDVELALKKLRMEIDSGKRAIKLAIENPLAASLSYGFRPLAMEDTTHRITIVSPAEKIGRERDKL